MRNYKFPNLKDAVRHRTSKKLQFERSGRPLEGKFEVRVSDSHDSEILLDTSRWVIDQQ